MVIYRMVIFRKSVLNDYIKIMKVHHAFFLLLAIFLLGGCSYEQVISDVDQKQANEIVASLGSHGISSIAQTERSSKGKYTVEVDKGNYALAVTLLHELGLPKEATPSFRDLTEQKGFLPNSREIESARLDYALGVEIEEKLKSVGGIDSVKVLVRSNLIKGGVEPSASVIISSSISIGGSSPLKIDPFSFIFSLLSIVKLCSPLSSENPSQNISKKLTKNAQVRYSNSQFLQTKNLVMYVSIYFRRSKPRRCPLQSSLKKFSIS